MPFASTQRSLRRQQKRRRVRGPGAGAAGPVAAGSPLSSCLAASSRRGRPRTTGSLWAAAQHW